MYPNSPQIRIKDSIVRVFPGSAEEDFLKNEFKLCRWSATGLEDGDILLTSRVIPFDGNEPAEYRCVRTARAPVLFSDEEPDPTNLEEMEALILRRFNRKGPETPQEVWLAYKQSVDYCVDKYRRLNECGIYLGTSSKAVQRGIEKYAAELDAETAMRASYLLVELAVKIHVKSRAPNADCRGDYKALVPLVEDVLKRFKEP